MSTTPPPGIHPVEIGRLAVRTGVWPLKEYIDGKVVHTRRPHPRPAHWWY